MEPDSNIWAGGCIILSGTNDVPNAQWSRAESNRPSTRHTQKERTRLLSRVYLFFSLLLSSFPFLMKKRNQFQSATPSVLQVIMGERRTGGGGRVSYIYNYPITRILLKKRKWRNGDDEEEMSTSGTIRRDVTISQFNKYYLFLHFATICEGKWSWGRRRREKKKSRLSTEMIDVFRSKRRVRLIGKQKGDCFVSCY